MLQGNPNHQKGFLKTTLAVCSGTEEFISIIKFPFSKTLSHFLAIALLASIFYIVIKTPMLIITTSKYCDALYSYFGGIRLDANGIVPLKNEDKTKKIKILSTRIDYIPSPQTEHNIEDSGAANGVIWLPNALYFWVKAGSDYQYFPILSAFPKGQKSSGVSTKLEQILNIAKKDNFTRSIHTKESVLDFSQLKLLAFILFAFANFAWMLINIIFSVPLYAFIILAVFTIFGTQTVERIKTINFFSVIIYSSFPAIIIATIYSALSLPIFDFKTICFISSAIYSFVVINSLQKKLNPKKQEDDDYDDSDIF